MNQDDAIIELETKVAFLERSLQELSDVVAQQQQEILTLTKNNKWFINKLSSLGDDGEIDPAFEKPPHY